MADLQHVSGLKELQASLKQLPDNIAKNVLRSSVRAGAVIIKKEAVIRAPVYTGEVAKGHPPPGTLKRAIYQKQINTESNIYKQVFFVAVKQAKNGSVGNKSVKSYSNKDAFYWKWVEFGTSKMTARPFLRPAFEAKKEAAVAAIKDYLTQRIPLEIAKLPFWMGWK